MNTNQIINRRIEWIDFCKAFAIIAVIIGHTVKFGSFTRNFIFSFHMPLFFLLSGFTMTFKINSGSEFRKQIDKDMKHLLLPMFLVVIISFCYKAFVIQGHPNILGMVVEQSKVLFWASGVDVHKTPALGMMWFLVSLFFSRMLMFLVFWKFSEREAIILALGIGFIGLLLGARKVYLPFNFDVTFVACMYMTCGFLLKKYYSYISKYKVAIFAVSTSVWLYSLSLGVYIELASRSYPYLVGALVQSLAASLSVILFIESMSSVLPKKLLSIGKNTLIIFVVHALDYIIFSMLGYKVANMPFASIVRVLSVLCIASTIIMVLSTWKKKV